MSNALVAADGAVLGTSLGTSTFGGVGVAGEAGIGGTGLLALTGAGPGTLVLALTGLASLVAGALAMLLGRELRTSNDPSSSLRDLSYRTVELH
jgi:hypothetical protein